MKHTKEYAEKLGESLQIGMTKEELTYFSLGYMKAIEQTNAKELLETLQRALNDFKNQTWTEETYTVINNAINKATL